jgi:hypothetical protein
MEACGSRGIRAGPARSEFRSPASGFGLAVAAAVDIAALQRGWRDFRMAQ